MVVTIAYGQDYSGYAQLLSAAVKERWTDCKINLVGLSSPEYEEKYQIQLEKDIVYSKKSGAVAESTDNIVTMIEERL